MTNLSYKNFTNLRQVLEEQGVEVNIPIMAAIEKDIEAATGTSKNTETEPQVQQKQDFGTSFLEMANESRLIGRSERNRNDEANLSLADKFRSRRIIK